MRARIKIARGERASALLGLKPLPFVGRKSRLKNGVIRFSTDAYPVAHRRYIGIGGWVGPVFPPIQGPWSLLQVKLKCG